MEYDTSFEDLTDGKKFIAVVVSDNEDDYNSYDESGPEEEVKSTIKEASRSVASPTRVVSGTPGKKGSVRGKSEEKKRWSFMSNHSSSSSNAKKRWSALSTFTLDSGAGHSRDSKDKENRDSKFVKRVSTHSSLSSHKRASIISIGENEPTTKSPHSLKRSSTGSSLRQLFGLIALNDENKENHNVSDREPFKQPSVKASKSKIFGTQTKERRNSNFRAPLAPMVNEANRQRHSVALGNNAYNNYSMSSMSASRESGAGFHTHSPSISSLSSVTSSSSKWRFWKRNNSSSLSRSSSNQSLNVTRENGSATDNTKVKNRSSLADLHKSFFSHSNNSGGIGGLDFNDSASAVSSTLSKRPSSSNLSINGLKHRSSQSSLKHKTSHSSLQRFKTRRKSNNTCGGADDCSSSGSQAPQISLPVPDQVSRDKIRAKLRNSTSLLSLGSATPVVMKDYDEALLAQILELCDTRHVVNEKDMVSSLADAHKLTSHVFSPKNESVIFKKLPLGTLEDVTYSKEMCLQELKMLRLCKGTTGLPWLLHSYVVRENADQVDDDQLSLLLVLKNHGTPLSHINLTSWSQALHIFWQCATILYVAETKFHFEHRNLVLDHILVDRNLNVTLCDLKCSRAQMGPDEPVVYTRLDHPLFFQGGGDYQYEIYKLMRFILAETCSWDSYEPRTNLLWLHYLCVKLLQNYETKLNKSGSARDKFIKMAQLVDPGVSTKRGLFKRHEIEIKTCGDLLRFK